MLLLPVFFFLAADREYVWTRGPIQRTTDNELAVLVQEDDTVVRTRLPSGPLSLVVRLHHLAMPPVERTMALATAHGINTIEIDYDCATSKLDEYAHFLRTLDRGGLRIRITALPTWGEHALFNLVDEVTLQVHSVRAPALFDAAQAWKDVGARDVWIALPTYGTTLKDGTVIAADAAEVVAFAKAVRPLVKGIAWFRTPSDTSSWSRATLDAVQAGLDVKGELITRRDAQWVELENIGDADMIASRVCVDAERADPIAGFRYEHGCFVPSHARYIRPRERIRVGWAR